MKKPRKKEPRKSTTVTISAALHRELSALCKQHGLKIGAVMEAAVQVWLSQIKGVETSSTTGTNATTFTQQWIIIPGKH